MRYDIKHDKINQLFVTKVDGKDVYLRYSMIGNDTIVFNFTYVPDELRRKGLAAIVVREGFKYAEENNLKVIPSCTYIHSFLQKHPEYLKFIK
jgi:predicted GNAT family acetyltransferase